MAGICCGVVGESKTQAAIEPSSRPARRRRVDVRHLKFVAGVSVPTPEKSRKRQKLEVYDKTASEAARECENALENCKVQEDESVELKGGVSVQVEQDQLVQECPKFGMTSVRGRRRDMEDAVSIHPSFWGQDAQNCTGLHYYGVYDGHGCSHVAMKCKDRMHEIAKEEIERCGQSWEQVMERSFSRMDKEVVEWCNGQSSSNCRCELRTPQCDAVGSTAVVAIVTPEKVVVSNCGDSRAVLCRNGVAIPLSSDHKPDRPDELLRIQAAGGRVIYWDVPRVLGVLAMSRAIGDNYLKPYVISEPEVTTWDRSPEDECLILASDGLWDVVSNDTACGVARMCLNAQAPPSPPVSPETGAGIGAGGESSDKACLDASMLLTKLALARDSADNVSVVVVDLRNK